MKTRLLQALRARRGVALTELLVAVAILGLVTAAVATGIAAGSRTYQQSITLSRSQILLSTLSQAVADELRYAWDISGSGTQVDYTGPYGAGSHLEAQNGQLVVQPAGAPAAQLVGSGAYGAYTAAIETTYDEVTGCFHVTLTIDHAAETVLTQALAVRALNPA